MFLPTDDQRELQRGVRDVLAGVWPLEKLSGPPPATAEELHAVWSPLGDFGLWDLQGELGLGWADTVGVFEEFGRFLLPGPVVPTFLLAHLAVNAEPGPVTAAGEGDVPLVSGLSVSTWVALIGAEQVRLLRSDDLRANPLPAVDPLSSLHEVESWPDGIVLDIDAVEFVRRGALLTAAVQVGIAGRLTDLAVDYAKSREQFGRTIGGFQAVKHICADMYARAELARVAVQAAAVTLDDPEVGDVGRAVAGAKLLADEAATMNGRSCVQVHGGMGFTWEVPVHFFLKRAWRHATEWLTDDEAAEAVAVAL